MKRISRRTRRRRMSGWRWAIRRKRKRWKRRRRMRRMWSKRRRKVRRLQLQCNPCMDTHSASVHCRLDSVIF